jgi:cytidylate kinase
MSVITITRQYGAGGSEVARLAAEKLGWQLVDNEFVDEVAKRSGVSTDEVAANEERAPSLLERLVRALASSSPEVFVPGGTQTTDKEAEALVTTTEHVIAEAGQSGNVVLVGRGAQAYFARAHAGNVLHVFVVAPLTDRIRTLAARLGISEDEAKQQAEVMEGDRDRYVHRYYKRQRQDASNYHLVVNTGQLGYEGAADLVICAAQQRFG